MKIACIGAGAMNCYYGGFLSQNNETYMIDVVPDIVNQMNENGLRVDLSDGTTRIFRPKACFSGKEVGQVDLVIVFVKTYMTKTVLEANRELFGENTYALTLQNGGGNDQDFLEYVSPDRLLLGITEASCTNLGPAHTKNTSGGAIHFGSYRPNKEMCEKVAAMFVEAGFTDTEYVEDPFPYIWRKLILNSVMNCLTTVLKTTMSYPGRNEYAWGLALDLIREGVQVAAADGVEIDLQKETDLIKWKSDVAADGRSSMLQDYLHCRKTEVDKISGFIAQKAKEHGVPAPINEMLVRMIHALEGTYNFAYRIN